MIKLIVLLLMLSGCAKPIYTTATKSTLQLKPEPTITNETIALDPTQIKLIEDNVDKATNTGQLLENALKNSRQRPQEHRFLNATTIYDFISGGIYQVYTAPQKVTMISFGEGETIVAAPQSGDTVRWQINSISSGSDANVKQHLIIKPLREDLTNNMIITTNKGRVYLLELISLKNSYMAEVSWNYAPERVAVNTVDNFEESVPRKFNFNYKLINKRGKPSWRPTQVFDDGQKTFIQFPDSINQNELPTLFIVSRETNTQLVNYRQQGNSLIIDRLFQEAELKLGLLNPEIVRIKRIK